MMAVTTTLCPLAKTYAMLIVYTLLFGIFDGAFVTLIAILTGDIVGSQKLPSALGFLYLVFSVPITTGPLIAGMTSRFHAENPVQFTQETCSVFASNYHLASFSTECAELSKHQLVLRYLYAAGD